MKSLIVLSMIVAFVAAASMTPEELEFVEAFDYDAVFNNEEQSKIVMDCLLEKGNCGQYQKVAELSLKILETQCSECNAAQKAKFDRVVKTFHDKYEDVYNEVMKKIAAKKA